MFGAGKRKQGVERGKSDTASPENAEKWIQEWSYKKKIIQDHNNIKHFLGLPSLSFLTFFLQFLAPHYYKLSFWKGAGRPGSKKWQEKNQQKPGKQKKWTMKEELILVMLKSRLDLDNATLSLLFNVSVWYVSTLFVTWINFLAQILIIIKLSSGYPKKRFWNTCIYPLS